MVSLSVNAVHEAWNRRPRAFAHADRLAQAVSLDMAAAGWKPTVDIFLGRVTKARILQAVTEAKAERAAELMAHLKKGDMAREAEALLADSGWLPQALRTQPSETASEETAEIDGATAMGDSEDLADSEGPEAISPPIAAE